MSSHSSIKSESNSDRPSTWSEHECITPGIDQIPVFNPVDEDSPTRRELVAYARSVGSYANGVKVILDFIKVPASKFPENINTQIYPNLSQPHKIWRKAFEIAKGISNWERALNAANNNQLKQTLSHKIKPSLPQPFEGQTGDQALAFIAACSNYKILSLSTLNNNEVMVRWALQQTWGKGNSWAVKQIQRLEQERDYRGRAPKELRDWGKFVVFSLNTFGDPSIAEKARRQWMRGIVQKGNAEQYFNKIEDITHRLSYNKDAKIILDQVKTELKPYLRTQFIKREWTTFNEMKQEVIAYEKLHGQINPYKPTFDPDYHLTSSEEQEVRGYFSSE